MSSAPPLGLRTRHKLTTTLTVLALAAGSGESHAQQQEVQEVIVTGSRIARSEGAQAAPLVALPSEEFVLSGTSNVESILNTLPQLVPGLTSASGSITEGNGTASADLRGLGGNRTLVLVNGRRWLFADAQQLADLNTIPQALVKRVEVVTGGSSAVYGSDAIAGVVNFVLDDSFEGFEVSAKTGQTFRGDGEELDVNVTSGGAFAEGRGHAVFALNYFDRAGVRAGARSYSRDELAEVIGPDGQARIVPTGGNATVPQGRFSGYPTGAALNAYPGLANALQAAGLGSSGTTGFIVDDGVQRPFTQDDLFNTAPYANIVIPQRRWSASAFTNFELNDSVEAYAEGVFSNNVVDMPIAPALMSQTVQIQTNNPFVTPELRAVFAQLDAIDDQRPGGGIANDGLVSLSIARRMMEHGDRSTRTERNAFKVTTGVRGDIGDLSADLLQDLAFDASFGYGRTANTLSRSGVLSRSRFSQGVLVTADGSACLNPAGGCVPINPFGANTITPEGVDYLSVDGAGGTSVSTLKVGAASLTGTLFDLPAGPFGFVFGGEWRQSAVEFVPDEFTATGDVAGFSAAAPATAGEVTVKEFFTELRAPLLRDLPLIDTLTANGAVRYSDYDISGVGEVWTYFGGLEWGINDSISLRGQYQRAIRAPSLLELFAPVSTGITVILDPCATPRAATDARLRATCIGNGVPEALVGDPGVQTSTTLNTLIGGNDGLEPEVADTFTIGATFQPAWVPNLRITLDYFNIELEGAIGALAGGAANTVDLCFNILQDPSSAACRAISRNALTGSIGGDSGPGIDARNVNISSIEVAGIDFGIAYRWNLDWGWFTDSSSLSFAFDGSWLERYTVTPVPDLPDQENECAGTFGTICGEVKPKFKSTSRINWDQGPLGLSLRWRMIGAVEDDRIAVGGLARERSGAAELSAQHYFDVVASWDATDQFAVVAGVNNVFDREPPQSMNFGNSRFNTYDGLGSRYFVNLTARF